MDLKLRCSASGCDCTNFLAAATKDSLRTCDGCSHSWMTHLLEKLLTSRDDALSIFDVCSLALYGTHALPIRLKIVIERLLATLQPDEVDKILRSFGWTPQDLSRGYMTMDPRGGLLAKWTMPPREEEVLILQQFLRFQATRALSFALLRDDFPLMSPGMTLPANNFSSLFHPSLNLLTPGQIPGGNNPLLNNGGGGGGGGTTNNNNLSSGASSNNGSGGSNASLLSPKTSPLNHNNNNTLVPGSLFPHLNLGALGMPGFPPVSLPNFGPQTTNSHGGGSGNGNGNGQSNNGKGFHHHHQNNEANNSGERSRNRNSRRSTNSSALNLSVQSESDEEERESHPRHSSDHHLQHHQNERKQMNEVVDLSSSHAMVNGEGGKKRSSHSHHTPSNTSSEAAERDRLLNSLNSLLPSSMNSLVSHHIGKGGEMSENHHHQKERERDRGDREGRNEHMKNGPTNPLGMSNELLNNLNNMHKSVDLMAAAAAMAGGNGPVPHPQGMSSGPQHHHQNQHQHQHQHSSGRKGMQPMKRDRGWNPLPIAAQLVNPSSAMTSQGKRRVQCSVCLKTFCDKGALKIHFSAVHLREMHKCTVAGCNMMFSSRRSRNRHSANPNPKLHSPHLRRKISPHDGRSSQPLINLNNPMLFPGGAIRFPPFIPGMGLPQNGGMGGMGLDGKDDDKSSDDETMDLGKHLDKLDGGIMMDPDGSISEASFSSEANDESFEPKTSPSNPNSKKDGARKRKLTNPIRLSNVADDSNDEFCCYDDGTVVSNEDEDIEDNDENSDKFNKSEDGSSKLGESVAASPQNGEPSTPPKQGDKEKGATNKRRHSEGGNEDKGGNKGMKDRRLSDDNHNEKKAGQGELGEGDEEEPEPDHLGKLESLPIFSSGSPQNSDSSMKSEEEDNREGGGSPNSSGDIPIDPENPRRCQACSKVFQNHFGVKTHYQNVHLKLLHKCTVDGCNATFPSKRSRDRHASNLNLHRKLLSTSDISNHSSNDSFTEERRKGASSVSPSLPISLLPQSENPNNIADSLHPFFNPFLFQNGSSLPGAFGLPNQTLNTVMGNPSWNMNNFLPFNLFPNVFGSQIPLPQKDSDIPSIVDVSDEFK